MLVCIFTFVYHIRILEDLLLIVILIQRLSLVCIPKSICSPSLPNTCWVDVWTILDTSWEGLLGFQTPQKVFGGFWKTRVHTGKLSALCGRRSRVRSDQWHCWAVRATRLMFGWTESMGGSIEIETYNMKKCGKKDHFLQSHTIHVWYIYLDLVDFYGKSR